MTPTERVEARRVFNEACQKGVAAVHDVAMSYFIRLCDEADALQQKLTFVNNRWQRSTVEAELLRKELASLKHRIDSLEDAPIGGSCSDCGCQYGEHDVSCSQKKD